MMPRVAVWQALSWRADYDAGWLRGWLPIGCELMFWLPVDDITIKRTWAMR